MEVALTPWTFVVVGLVGQIRIIIEQVAFSAFLLVKLQVLLSLLLVLRNRRRVGMFPA